MCVGACRACECKCVRVLVEARGQHYMPSQSLSTFCVCACVCVHVCTCVWRPEFSIRSLPPSLSMLLFETGSVTEPGARIVTNKLHLAFFVPPPVLALHECMATSAFYVGAGDLSSGGSLVAQSAVFPASLFLLFCLPEVGTRTSHLRGRHCSTEPHLQHSPPLYIALLDVSHRLVSVDLCQV